jgi:uncharacterized membrane protein
MRPASGFEEASMGTIVIAYAATLIVFAACDAIWLGVVAADLYRAGIGHLLAATPNWTAAALFYLLFIVGLVHFAVMPGLRAARWSVATGNAALFGLIAYATYDLTNLATLRGWPVGVVVADLAWGTFVSAVASTAGYAATHAWSARKR